MKTSIGAIVAAVVASACCIGPVAFAAIGSGALAAASTRLAPARLPFLILTAALLGLAFYRIYRTPTRTCEAGGTCAPGTNRKARILLWIAAVAAGAIAAFPYYSEYLF